MTCVHSLPTGERRQMIGRNIYFKKKHAASTGSRSLLRVNADIKLNVREGRREEDARARVQKAEHVALKKTLAGRDKNRHACSSINTLIKVRKHSLTCRGETLTRSGTNWCT